MSNIQKNEKRKTTQLNEITDRTFTVVDLAKLNSDVKTPTIRTHVKRSLESGRYAVSGIFKSGKRGKPSVLYTYVHTKSDATTANKDS